MNRFANPKSKMYILFYLLSFPIKKLSGLISLCIIPLECINSILSKNYNPIITTVFKENFFFFETKISSNDAPNKSITIKV